MVRTYGHMVPGKRDSTPDIRGIIGMKKGIRGYFNSPVGGLIGIDNQSKRFVIRFSCIIFIKVSIKGECVSEGE